MSCHCPSNGRIIHLIGTSRGSASAVRIFKTPIISRGVFGGVPRISLINATGSIFSEGALDGEDFVPCAKPEMARQKKRANVVTLAAKQLAALPKYVSRNAPSFSREYPGERRPNPCDSHLAKSPASIHFAPQREPFP